MNSTLSGRNRFLVAFFLILYFSCNLSGQNLDSLLLNKRVYQPVNIGTLDPAKIDGVLDDEIWNLGEWQGNFTQQQPYGNTRGSESTYVKVLYDHSGLYVAIVCQDDDPEKIRDMFDRRDALTGDMTGIAIDSYYDKTTAFEFNLSAAGQKMDLKHLGDYQWDFNWDAVWDGATSMIDTGWVAEMRIPFSQIRYSNEAEHTWGMHVWRWIDRKKEEDQWQYIPLEAPAMVYLFGDMKGMKDIKTSRQIEFLPYALGSYNKSGDNPFNGSGGLDAKVGISSDYTLDLTVNPDFGQVEADPSVLNLSAYETFYDEKRPFFLEGNDVFDFEMDGDLSYYSRRIGSVPETPSSYGNIDLLDKPGRTTILSAAKITGKSKKGLSVGLVNGITARENGTSVDELGKENEFEVAPLSNFMSSRVKKEFEGGNSNIGGFFSSVNRFSDDPISQEILPSGAYTGGVDMLHQWKNRNYFVEAKAIVSQLSGSSNSILIKQLSHIHRYQRPDADHLDVDSTMEKLSGHGGFVRIGKKGGKWNFSGEGQYRSPGLNLNDMGYIRQSDYFGERAEISYDMNKPTTHIRDWNVKMYQEANWSFGGELNKSTMGASFSISNLKLWSLFLSGMYNFSHVDTRELRGGPALRNDPYYRLSLNAGSNSSKDFYGNLGYSHIGSVEDFFTQNSLNMSLTWLPIRRMRFSAFINLSEQSYAQQFVKTIYTSNTQESIVGNLERNTASFTLRGELFITPEISLQYYGNPYFSAGKYDQFKRVSSANSYDLNERFEMLNTTYDEGESAYSFDLGAESYSFSDPDFSFIQYRSNVVFRWEYSPGSTLYFVWSHDRSDWRSVYNPVSDITGDLFGLQGNNVFMMKLNYWFSL
jgi:hypothetical protein